MKLKRENILCQMTARLLHITSISIENCHVWAFIEEFFSFECRVLRNCFLMLRWQSSDYDSSNCGGFVLSPRISSLLEWSHFWTQLSYHCFLPVCVSLFSLLDLCWSRRVKAFALIPFRPFFSWESVVRKERWIVKFSPSWETKGSARCGKWVKFYMEKKVQTKRHFLLFAVLFMVFLLVTLL